MARHHIYFLISDQHFIPTGGIGSFFRGFLRMADHFGWAVTVVLDKAPRGNGKTMMKAHPSASYVFPGAPASYRDHNPSESQYKQEIPNTFKQSNFTSALKRAQATGQPTHMLINTPEAALSVIELGLQTDVPTIFYTHHENLVLNPIPKSNKFAPSYMEMLHRIVAADGITAATQSNHNVTRMEHLEFSSPLAVLPMPIPDPQLMLPYDGERRGVLFIGRHEPRKQPTQFAAKVAKAGLPAKVLTNKMGEENFRKTFEKNGITDFEIRSEITGQEKADFIRSARIAFHPAKLESYGFSAMETLAAGLPTLLVHEYGWWQAFIDDGVHITPIRDAQNKLRELYDKPQDAASNYGQDREQQTFSMWEQYLNSQLHSR